MLDYLMFLPIALLTNAMVNGPRQAFHDVVVDDLRDRLTTARSGGHKQLAASTAPTSLAAAA